MAINHLHRQKAVLQFSHGMKARVKSDREFYGLSALLMSRLKHSYTEKGGCRAAGL